MATAHATTVGEAGAAPGGAWIETTPPARGVRPSPMARLGHRAGLQRTPSATRSDAVSRRTLPVPAARRTGFEGQHPGARSKRQGPRSTSNTTRAHDDRRLEVCEGCRARRSCRRSMPWRSKSRRRSTRPANDDREQQAPAVSILLRPRTGHPMTFIQNPFFRARRAARPGRFAQEPKELVCRAEQLLPCRSPPFPPDRRATT